MSFLINFEGLHGCGKTTQAKLLETTLNSRSITTEYISSADKPLSSFAMDFLKKNGSQDPETLFFLALANDFSLGERFKESEKVFILDRYIYTSIASTYAAGKPLHWIEECLTPFLYPNLAFFIDVPANVASQRKNSSASRLERGAYQRGRGDSDFMKYQTCLREAYLTIASHDKRLIVIDGTKSTTDIHTEIMAVVGRGL